MPLDRRPVLLSLLGDSGAGKTTLAVDLVARWRGAGLRVGYVKHASHGFEMDRPGKDSARATAAGADGVVVTGPGGTAFLEPEPRAEDPRALVARFLADRDVVVLEGFRDAALPSVAIAAPAEEAGAAAARIRGRRLAVVAASGHAGSTPVFAPGEGDALARHLEALLGIAARPASAPRSERRAAAALS